MESSTATAESSPHPDRAVDVALAEFNALRGEVLSHITAQAAVIGLGLTALGVILGITKGGENEELLLAVPPIALLVVLLHVVRSYRMETIGRYIRNKLWPYLQSQVGPGLPSWEGEVADPKLSPGSIAQALFVEFPPLLLFIAASVFALIQVDEMTTLWWAGVAMTALALIGPGVIAIRIGWRALKSDPS